MCRAGGKKNIDHQPGLTGLGGGGESGEQGQGGEKVCRECDVTNWGEAEAKEKTEEDSERNTAGETSGGKSRPWGEQNGEGVRTRFDRH